MSQKTIRRKNFKEKMSILRRCSISSEWGASLRCNIFFSAISPETTIFPESLENFWTQAEESGEFPSNRIFRKARNYAEKIIAGVYEHEQEIDRTIESFSKKWDIDRMPVVDRNIMRVAIFELEFCPDIPALVSIDEAIEISKDFSSEKSGIFINGILNGVKDSLPAGAKNPPGQKTNGEND